VGLRVLDPIFRDYGGVTAFSGPVATVKVHEDNVLVREALSSPGDGRVLVVDGGASLRYALVGDQLAQLAIDNGWRGIVVSGCIRDAEEMGAMPIGVKALATNPRKSVKRGQGVSGETVEIAGVTVAPGDWLYADRDGVIVAAQPLA
jgi:regulator of ribonuclease activity A